MEVYVTISKIVSVFQEAIDALQKTQTRREKKLRKKEKDVESLVEGRMLHRSLTEGRDQCQKAVSDRHQQYGMPFDVGDSAASLVLKDVVISLQGDVLQALLRCLTNEKANVDLGRLLDHSITNRQATLRAMDELCQRLPSYPPSQGTYDDDGHDLGPTTYESPVSRTRRAGQIQPLMYQTRSDDSADSLLIATTASTHQAAQCPSPLHLQRIQSVRRAIGHRNLPNREVSYVSAGSVQSDRSGLRNRSPEIDANIHRAMVREEGEDNAGRVASLRGRPLPKAPSMQDSVIGSPTEPYGVSLDGTESGQLQQRRKMPQTVPERAIDTAAVIKPPRAASTSSAHAAVSLNSSLPEGAPRRAASLESSSAHSPIPAKATLQAHDEMSSDSSDASPVSSHTRTGSEAASMHTETAEDRARAIYAPEVVTKEFESMLLQPGRPSLQGEGQSRQSEIHPALRKPFQMPALPPSTGVCQSWLPLPPPAPHNNYHGFCQGAWQIRKNIREGLSISMIPNANGVEIPHWKCKLCEYRSKGVSLQSANVLPDEIFFHPPSNIRYRWRFLAKSHVSANVAHTKPEGYAYGCMFCAAQGRSTDEHNDLDGLMLHIVSKHKTVMMTPETRGNTKAVVGGMPDKADEWDVNLPETKKAGLLKAVGEFTVAAVTGLSKYG